MMSMAAMSAKTVKVSVLLPPDAATRFDAYCRERGYKKSTLIVRLIREHLDRENFPIQEMLFDEHRTKRDGK